MRQRALLVARSATAPALAVVKDGGVAGEPLLAIEADVTCAHRIAWRSMAEMIADQRFVIHRRPNEPQSGSDLYDP